MPLNMNVQGSFSVPGNSQVAGTVITAFIPPYAGNRGGVRNHLVDTGFPNWSCGSNTFQFRPKWLYGPEAMFTHVTDMSVTAGANILNPWVWMRPLNWTYFKTAVATNTTQITSQLFDDPGVYSTNYKYPLPSGVAVAAADAAISSTNKYVMYQLADGTWKLDTIASGTFGGANIVLTTGTPNVNSTGATIPALSPLFYFGAAPTIAAAGIVTAPVDPATGLAPPSFQTPTATTTNLGSYAGSLFNSLHPGDPLMLYCLNQTAAMTLNGAWGVYTKDW